MRKNRLIMRNGEILKILLQSAGAVGIFPDLWYNKLNIVIKG